MDTTFTFDKTNKEQCLALDLVQNTNISFFLTGCAGTGKTTFLQYIQQNVKKQFVLVAPTGIAALVAGGTTIHSFFGMPWEPITSKTTLDDFSLNDSKWETLRAVDTIIIDEVSMVRCDMIDGIDKVLRAATLSSLPFGGKQIIFSGDLYQLDPVYQTNDEGLVNFYQEEYHTYKPYFFYAHVFQQMKLFRIELQKVYRQKDAQFLSILKHIRQCEYIRNDIELLNTTGLANDTVNQMLDKDEQLTLSAYRATVDAINEKKLQELPEPSYTYTGQIEGKFNKNNSPAPMELTLKIGARVMFVKNDSNHLWVNGTLGTVENLSEEDIEVVLDNGLLVNVDRERWDAIEYEYDKETGVLDKVVVGSYSQYPLTLAWAITIHKSQGMTFDKVTIDLERGIFAAGQLYVALSRVTSLKGMALNAIIKPSYIKPKKEVEQFMQQNRLLHDIENAIIQNEGYYNAFRKQDYDMAMKEINRQFASAIEAHDMDFANILATQLMDGTYNPEEFLADSLPQSVIIEKGMRNMLTNAIISAKNAQYDEALNYIRRGLVLQPSTHLYYLKSIILFELKRFEEAKQLHMEWKQYLKKHYDEVNTTYLLCVARTNFELGLPYIKEMQRIIRRNKSYYPFILRLRKMMLHDNDYLEEDNVLAQAFNSSDSDFEELLRNSSPDDYDKLIEAILKHPIKSESASK